MKKLRPDLVLRRAPNLKVLIAASGEITILAGGAPLVCGSLALTVLEAFTYPGTLAQALERLEGRVAGVQDWIDLTATISQMYDARVLIGDAHGEASPGANPGRFHAALLHTRMLNDRARTSAYLAAIRDVVRPGDIVVDIGTGTGILAMAAARAGARRVYAIEADAIANAAQALFKANGLDDRITLFTDWSQHVGLPERADVLITETVGSDPLAEEVLEIILDARKRLLKPGARIVPGKLRVFGLPVTIPDKVLAERTFAASAIEKWQAWYGMAFQPLREMTGDHPQTFLFQPQHAAGWTAIAEPVLLAEIDFSTVQQTTVEHTGAGTASVAGELSGVLTYFELDLGPGTVLSTHPKRADPANHWDCLVWVAAPAVTLQAGDRFAVTYRYRVPGTEDRLQVAKV
jgi:protein arginine N-methyltransferase 1